MAEPMQPESKEQKRLIRMAETISQALPYMRRLSDANIVVKYGGHAMTDPHLGDIFARDIVLMKQVGMNPIVVHGGGPQINRMLERVGIKSNFVHGLRVTDAATMEIVEMVLAGAINKAIVADINECGGTAVGISGKDGNLILARRVTEMPDPTTGKMLKVDLGLVGEPARINVRVLEQLTAADTIPVVAPVGFGVDAGGAVALNRFVVRATREAGDAIETVPERLVVPIVNHTTGAILTSFVVEGATVTVPADRSALFVSGDLATQAVIDAVVSIGGFEANGARAIVASTLGFTPETLPVTVPMRVRYDVQP